MYYRRPLHCQEADRVLGHKAASFRQRVYSPIAVLVATQPEYLSRPRLFHRNHKVTYPCDASVGRALDDMPTHVTIAPFSGFGLQGEIDETADWIASTLPRKLGFGETRVANLVRRSQSVLRRSRSAGRCCWPTPTRKARN